MEIWHCLTWELNTIFMVLISHVPSRLSFVHIMLSYQCKPGVSWVNMHKLAERTILESLKEGNLLFGDVDAMVNERLGAVFMPHGLGHLLGIDTHDTLGERKDQRKLDSSLCARVETLGGNVEPGCYFIDALLLPAMENAQTSQYFNHEQIHRFRGFGGVRIESDVYVTSDGCVNMTKCPREIQDIEAVMAGAPWPIKKTSILL
ncbi:Xaa-Pro dipeptidase [Sesamum angolense]|uniref:Xaa-Pro dipeptidase n=1 Tax=Sesamum angolense TaxID=2727404 RepID=A0AAE1WNY0_9LAMI|nr:Xaa-Pro dipeptidase [Sesamum angolense]